MKQTTYKPLVTSALVALALSACGGAPKKIDSLEQARTAYSKAAGDVTVAKHAPEELDTAKVVLDHADHLWRDDSDRSDVDHYAYLASQRVKIAELIASSKEDSLQLENMKLERQRVQLDIRSGEIDKAKQETLALKRQMEELQAKNTERGIVLTLGDVLFDIDEATLKSTSAHNIDKIANFMRSYPERVAIVEGHTDNMGDEDYNMDLSRERAFSVRGALIQRGISASRISTTGFGEAQPVASNDSSTGRRENRRVEMIFPDTPTQVSELAD